MNHKGKILWITRTAGLTALLITLQAITAPFGQIVTGSVVNMTLIVSVMTCGFASGCAVAAISPVMAKFLGIGPFWSLLPFIAAGNAALAAVWYFIGNRGTGRKYTAFTIALITAAIVKFLILYFGVVQIALPMLGLPERQTAVISIMFSMPQLVNALIGGIMASGVLPALKMLLEIHSKD